jgi:hypothetical protein
MFCRSRSPLLVVVFVLLAIGGPTPAAAQPQPPIRNWFNSAHFELTIALAVNDGSRVQSLNLTGSGDVAVDPATQAVRMQRQVTAMGQTIEIRRVDNRTYVRIGATGQWRERDPADPANRSLFDLGPRQQAQLLSQVATPRMLGPDAVDGAPATKWAIEVDSSKLGPYVVESPGPIAQAIQGAQNVQMSREQLLAFISRSRIGGEFWVDDATGYLRRWRLMLELPGGTIPGQGGTTIRSPEIRAEATATYSRFNQPVTIEAPANYIPFTPGAAPVPGQPGPVVQMPRGVAMPAQLPRSGEVPLRPLALLGLALVGAGLGVRRSLRR